MKAPLFVLVLLLPQDSQPAGGRAALQALGKAQASVKTLRASYVQERSSALRKRPLVSRGTLLFRADPPCIVFEVQEPRRARIRIDERAYEVWRPDERQLERFVLESPDLPRALFQSFRPELDLLESRFVVQDGASDAMRHEVRLVPKDEKVKSYLTTLTLTIAARETALEQIAYTDGQGDRVVIRLERAERDPALAGDPFAPETGKDAQVIVHEPSESKAPRLQPGPESRETGTASRPVSKEFR